MYSDLFCDLENALQGEVHHDLTTRILYSTDASIYQIEPLGVVFPRTLDDLGAAVEIAARYRVPILARGAGSSLAGQAIGAAIVLDCSRYLTKIINVNPEEGSAVVEPGVILSVLNRTVSKFGLQFGPDPATADRATLGGSVGNNATGAHSILYGMSADHLLAVEATLADGTCATFSEVSLEEANHRAALSGVSLEGANHRAAFSTSHGHPSLESALYKTALDIRHNHAETIRQRFPRVWRRASGYNLNYLLPWSASSPPRWTAQNLYQNSRQPLPYPPIQPNSLNLAALFAGSESTLGVMRRLTLRLVPKLSHTLLAVLSFNSIIDACDVIPELLEYQPSAIELIPGDLIRLARAVPAYAKQLTFVQGNPPALLVVEFAGEAAQIRAQIERLKTHPLPKCTTAALVAETAAQQKQVWDVRKVGLGLFSSLAGDTKAVSFIEDLAVPVEHLGEFVREIERIMHAHATRANIYAHASAGCLHIRPLLNLKDVHDLAAMRSIAEQAVALTLRLGGASTGEHGDGIARSEWLENAYGQEVLGLFRALKQAADPHNILNPGKILNAPAMDTHLRYEAPYHTQAWQPVFDFSSQGSLAGAIEMCNGAGVCRKTDGVMCPSFQATQNEMFATRGRANLLRAAISNRFPAAQQAAITRAAYAALDLCLACKGCKAECPSTVDMAKLKYEFMSHYYATAPRKLRDYLFGYINLLAPLGAPFAPLLNAALAFSPVQMLSERLFGLTARRRFPRFAWLGKHNLPVRAHPQDVDCLFLSDTFSRYFHPETERCAVAVLQAAGLNVAVLPILGAGRTLISKGFLTPARRHAARLLEKIRSLDPHGKLPVVGVEPSEIFTLRDEFLDFFPGDAYAAALAQRSWMVDEFLLRPDATGTPRLQHALAARSRTPTQNQRVLLHGHCYQKAQPPAPDGYPTGVPATLAMLEAAGYAVEVIDCGCCGMAGAFGYESEHYEMSMQVGEMALFPAVRQAGRGVIIAAAGTSCRSQIEDGAHSQAVHPITLV